MKPLSGWRVLVPRGGPWGDMVAATLREQGAVPVVAPMINFAATTDSEALAAALQRLAAGAYDWLTVTSATTVDVLNSYAATVPTTTKIAAVGETTAAALTSSGFHADLVPAEENTARALLEEWEAATDGVVPLRVLALRSEIATPLLSTGLARIGHAVDSVIAYRTVGVPVRESVVADVASGRINAVLVTSGSVAEQVHNQLGSIPETTLVACIGPRTARDAERLGLRVDAIAEERSAESLLALLIAAGRDRAEG